VRDIEFDAIIDPFFDIYVTQLIDFLKYGGKYIFCGFYYQDILYKPFKGKYDIVIDSIYTGDEIVPFFYKSLFIAYRVLGK